MLKIPASLEPTWDWLVGPHYADERVTDWPLMDLPVALGISAAYVFGVPLGTYLMRNREPFKIRSFVALHNAILFLLSLYMSVTTVKQAYLNFNWGKKFSLWCNEREAGPQPFSPSGRALAEVLWVHYISKAYEFVDTFIMVLKKNNRQISFLHVYHHATTFFPVWWSVIRYGPGGESWFTCALNSFIHVLMYGYYFLATFGFRSKIMKPFVTYSQMIQFLVFIAQGIHLLVNDCYKPRLVTLYLLFQCTIFFILFANFALQNYWKKKDKSQ